MTEQQSFRVWARATGGGTAEVFLEVVNGQPVLPSPATTIEQQRDKRVHEALTADVSKITARNLSSAYPCLDAPTKTPASRILEARPRLALE